MRRDPSLSKAPGISLAGRAFAAALGTAVVVAALLSGCGSRGPLDDSSVLDAGLEAEVGTEAAVEAAAVPIDASPEGGGGVVACGTCILSTCGQKLLGCIQSAACRRVLQCVATQCLGRDSAGGLNPRCLFDCAGTDAQGALEVVEIFQCVTGECGSDCSSLLGALLTDSPGQPDGGGRSAGGGSGGGGDAEEVAKSRRAAGSWTPLEGSGGNDPAGKALAPLFSAWPELSSAQSYDGRVEAN